MFAWYAKTKAKLSQKLRDLWHVDSMIDLFVDILLVVFDAINTPILIFVRILRHFFEEWVLWAIKTAIKWFAHKVLRIPESK